MSIKGTLVSEKAIHLVMELTIIFNGVLGNTDEMKIYKLTRGSDLSHLRSQMGHNAQGYDRLTIGPVTQSV